MNIIRTLSVACAIGMASFMPSAGAEPTEPDPFELEFEQNINTPEVPRKKLTAVKNNIESLHTQLKREGFQIKKQRQGEVLVVTIPCERLFRANSTTLTDKGKTLLGRLRLNDDTRGKYKVIIAVHTDNTGEDAYADNITATRANAIDDYISAQMAAADIPTIPYGLGRDEQLTAMIRSRTARRTAGRSFISYPPAQCKPNNNSRAERAVIRPEFGNFFVTSQKIVQVYG